MTGEFLLSYNSDSDKHGIEFVSCGHNVIQSGRTSADEVEG